MVIAYPKEIAEFIEANACKEDNFYWLPSYFKKVGDGLFELVEFKNTDGTLKHLVEQNENPNEQ